MRERERKNSKELLVLRVILRWPLDMGFEHAKVKMWDGTLQVEGGQCKGPGAKGKW